MLFLSEKRIIVLLPLLQTKLYAPPVQTHCAPAGFGKPTLVSEWTTQADHPVAWLALDADDNDPLRFLHYLIAALQSCQPSLGENALLLLAAPQPPPPKAILTLLLNDLNALAVPLTLVLDDYHVITFGLWTKSRVLNGLDNMFTREGDMVKAE